MSCDLLGRWPAEPEGDWIGPCPRQWDCSWSTSVGRIGTLCRCRYPFCLWTRWSATRRMPEGELCAHESSCPGGCRRSSGALGMGGERPWREPRLVAGNTPSYGGKYPEPSGRPCRRRGTRSLVGVRRASRGVSPARIWPCVG